MNTARAIVSRCFWAPANNAAYLAYHDTEWGRPQRDNTVLFEMLNLEGAQAGLSWSTILNKRAGYRAAFANWDVKQIAAFDEEKVQELMLDARIVRNQLKIRATIANAQATIKMMSSEGKTLADFFWAFVDSARAEFCVRLGSGSISLTRHYFRCVVVRR
jgi:DNA-3-methyladenine glycosylase I